MFSFQVVVGFLVFIAGFVFLLSYVKRFVRLLGKAIFAWLNNKIIIMNSKAFTATKQKIFSCLDETVSQLDRPLKVVEIGAGAGANFEFLPKNTEIVCVEPNEYAKKYLLANAAKFPDVKLKEFHVGVAENMFFVAPESVDVVVSTHVLCSVKDVDQTMREILRILKKGGKLIFLEAVAGHSDHHCLHIFQHFCHFMGKGGTPTQRADVIIQNAGFDKTNIEIFDADISHLSFLLKPIVKHNRRLCAGVAIK